MRKIDRVFLTAGLALLCVWPGVLRAQYQTSTNNGQITIIGYTGSGSSVTIPAMINGLPVTGIGANAFYGKSIAHVTIGSNVTWIGSQAFEECTFLSSVSLSGSVTNIGD